MAALEHMALGLMAKPLDPKTNVFILMIATEMIDLLIIPIYFLKLEGRNLTHSLFMAIIWSIFFGLIALIIYRRRRTALTIALLVFSHWVIDFITHPMTFVFPNQINPDLPILFDNSIKVGLGLYKTFYGIIIGNILLWGAGITIYIRYKLKLKKSRKLYL